MAPRQAVGAVGYAIRAATAEVLAPGGNITLANPSTASAGNIMKGGNRFLHNSGSGNTFVGENAGNFAMSGFANTGSGTNALAGSTIGEWNTANGFQALASNQDGSYNTASGMEALVFNISGNNNTASGTRALTNSLGSNNIGVGANAGGNLTTGNYNIDIGNAGVAAEGNTIRIGDANQTRAFIAGIRGVTPGANDPLPVVIDSNGQLGTGVAGTVPGTFQWQVVGGTTQQAQPNTGYVVTDAGEVTLTLPVTPSVGATVRVSGAGAGGWKVAQNAGQSVTGTFLYLGTSSSPGEFWVPRDGVRTWASLASSANGGKLVALSVGDHIYTSTDSGLVSGTITTTPGVAGYLRGEPSTAIELQYVGSGKFLTLSAVGEITGN